MSIPIDIFLVAGQSNANGRGTAADSPTPPTGKVLQWSLASGIIDANDPIGTASSAGASSNTGSAWPAFGTAYYNTTQRYIAFVLVAVGSWQTSAGGNPNWDTSGTLFAASVTAVTSALTAFTTGGYSPTFKGVLWSQGENDAASINSTSITVAQYTAALRTMIALYRGQYGQTMPFYIFRTGTDNTSSDTGYLRIREAQEAVALIDPYTFIVFRKAATYGGIHYTQSQYNEMGNMGAGAVIGVQTGNVRAFQRNTFQKNAFQVIRVTSRRADFGLPDVANGFAYADATPGYGSYFDDGFTWSDMMGSVLAGKQPLEIGPSRLSPRASRRMRSAFGE